jgi:hypothetical protein
MPILALKRERRRLKRERRRLKRVGTGGGDAGRVV